MTSPAEPVKRCDVGVVFALAAEQGCFEDRLTEVRTTQSSAGIVRVGTLHGRTVVTLVAGAGRQAAARGCEALLVGHRPHLVISAGYCGGLQPQAKQFDVVVADRIVGLDGAQRTIDAEVLRMLQLPGACVGSFVEVDHIVARAVDKQALGKQTGSLACDMESAAVAEVCASRLRPMAAVRVVSDACDADLPDDLEPLMRSQSPARIAGAVLGALWRRPSSVKDLLRLKETALVAAEKLAAFLVDVVARLPVVAEPDSDPPTAQLNRPDEERASP